MPNFNPQQQPPGWLEGAEDRVNSGAKYMVAAVLFVGAYFFGLAHPQIPLAICLATGLVAGLLSIILFVSLIRGLGYAAVVLGIAYLTYLLLSSANANTRNHRPAPVQQIAPLLPGFEL